MSRRPHGAAPMLALAFVVALVLSACGTADGPPDAVRASARSDAEVSTTTSTTAPPVPSTTTSTTRAGATTTTRRPTTTTTRPGVATTVGGARALTPIAPGTYRYDTSGSTTFAGTSRPFPAVTTLVVDPPAGTVQHSNRSLRDAAGDGPASEFTLDYRPQGVYLVVLRLTVGLSGLSQSQELRPTTPVLLLATGATPGAHTDLDLPGSGGARLAVDLLREERVTIGGQGVDTVVMRATVTLAPGDVTGRLELTVNLDRTSRLWVKERSVTDAAAAGGLFTLHSDDTATLQRLTP